MKIYQRIPVLFLIIIVAVMAMTAILVPLAKATPYANQELFDNNSVTSCEVPSSYATIQAAVDEPTCELINVAPGLYVENVVIGRDVTIQGAGMNSTIVDGNNSGTVFDILPGLSITLSGLTARNGHSLSTPYSQGGGIRVYAGTLTVMDALISANTADFGAGIYAVASTVTVQQSEISNNSAALMGGGIAISGGVATVSDNSIIANNSAVSGAGISNGAGIINVFASTVASNHCTVSYGRGGGILSSNGSTNIFNSNITGNEASLGGGILSSDGPLTLTQSIVENNAASMGGGVYLYVASQQAVSAVIRDSLITNNNATDGGGIENGSSNVLLGIWNSTISDNSAQNSGGGIGLIGGSVTLTNSIVHSNAAPDGGGIHNTGTITMTHSSIANNSATNGGGIYNRNGRITITNSILNHNSSNYGGGIYCTSYSHVNIYNTTFSGNSASSGGGIYTLAQGGHMALEHTTFSSNSAGSGSSIATQYYPANVTIGASIISGNNGAACFGAIVSQGYNIANDSSCNLTGPGDMNSISPQLGPLQDNGGPTLTHMPQPGSPAIDAGHPLNCPPTDQRGIPRPQDGTGDGQAICDIGSVEYLLDAVPLSSVNVTGPAIGDVDTFYTFAATVTPISATQPIIYVWQVAGQATVTQTSGITDTVAFAWSLPGAYALAVTANNGSSGVTNTYTIMLNDRPIAGLLASNSSPANSHEIVTLTATITSGTNVSYTWEFGDGSSANGQVATHVYAQPGIFTTTVTAINSVSTVSATSVVTILESQYIVYLPFVSIP